MLNSYYLKQHCLWGTVKVGIEMGYLVCNKCGGYYELEEGESPEDFSNCECGGDLEYLDELDPSGNSSEAKDSLTCSSCGAELDEGTKFCGKCGYSVIPKSTKTSGKVNISDQKNPITKVLLNAKDHWMRFSTRMRIASLGSVLIILLILVGVLFSGNIAAAHYNDDFVSFDYPNEWKVTNFISGQTNYTDSEIGSSPVGNYTELNIDGPGVNVGTIKIYTLNDSFGSTFKSELKNYKQKNVNGYTYYENIGTGSTNSRNVGVFLKGNMGCTILIAGKKDQVDKGFNMIVNSFRFK